MESLSIFFIFLCASTVIGASLDQPQWNPSEVLKINQALMTGDSSLSKILLNKLEQEGTDPVEALNWGRKFLELGSDQSSNSFSDTKIFLLLNQTSTDWTWQIQVMTPREEICEGLSFNLNGHDIFSTRQRPFRVREFSPNSTLTCETSQIQFNHWRAWNTLVIQGVRENQTTHFLMAHENISPKDIHFQYSNGKITLRVPNFYSQAFIKGEHREIMVSVLKGNASAPLFSAMASVPSSNNPELKLDHFYKEEGLIPPPKGDSVLLVTFIESNDDKPVSIVRQYTSSQTY